MFPFFFFQTEATKESDMARYIHAPKEDEAARWSEVYTRFLPLTAIVWTEEQAAPMEDGALILPRLHVGPIFERPAPRLDLSLDGLPATLLPFPGRTRYAWTWFPYGLYDVAAALAGGK